MCVSFGQMRPLPMWFGGRLEYLAPRLSYSLVILTKWMVGLIVSIHPLPVETHSLTCLQLFKTTTFRGPSFSPTIEPCVLDHSWNLDHISMYSIQHSINQHADILKKSLRLRQLMQIPYKRQSIRTRREIRRPSTGKIILEP